MKRRLIGFVCMALAVLSVGAVPALQTPRTVVQPDGSTMTLLLTGDEWCHYYTTTAGTPVYRNKEGYYVPLSPFRMAMMRQRRSGRQTVHNGFAAGGRRAPARRGNTVETTGTQRVLVILAQFSDLKFSGTNPNAAFTQHLNAENYKGSGFGSARDYFIAQSGGLFTPHFDVYGPYTASKAMEYYGSNDSDGYDEHPGDLISEVLKLGNSDIDYKDYDSNGDGVVDFCYVIYAGYGEAQGADENTIWPHQWTLSDATGAALKLDGVQVNGYACSNELHGASGKELDGIGTICHEFGHCLGLPDFYDTSEEGTNFGMSVWSVMDYGCYNENNKTPAGYTAYEKEFMGWMDIETIDTEQELTLRPTADGGKAYRIVTGENTDEYYLIENIQKEGWNRAAYGHGLLITHVDYKASAWEENTVNSESPQRMTIIPADGSRTKTVRSWEGDPYPGSKGNTEFSDYSSPASLTNRNLPLSKPITDIREENGVIRCSFMKGCGDIVTALGAEAVTPFSFTARWGGRPETSEYVVEFYRINGTWPDDRSLWTTTLFTEQGELIRTVSTPDLKTTLYNLEADMLYCYRVRCRAHGVLSGYSNLIYVLTASDTGVLPAPVMGHPAVLGDSSFRLSWSPVEGATYLVEYEQTVLSGPTTLTPDGSLMMTEHFERVSSKCGEISRVLDMYTDTVDWRGTEVHAQENCVLLGAEDENGYLITPVLPRTSGMVTIEFSVRRYSADDKQPLFHVCLSTDASTTRYIDQIGGYVPKEEYSNYYCVLGPLDTGSRISFISNTESPSDDTPRICLDNLSFYWGDRHEEMALSRCQPFGGDTSRRLPVKPLPEQITTSSRMYVETADTTITLEELEHGNYVCRVRALRNGIYSPYSEAHTALVGASTFETNSMRFEVISLDHLTVQLMPFGDERRYEGDLVIPETITFEGVTYTVTALADSVFRDCRALTSVVVPPSVAFVGNKIFKGCTGLGWVDWQCEAAIDSTDFIGTADNTLLYVSGDTEVVSSDVIVVRDGEADDVTLYINSPFLAPRSFKARHIRYRKDFSQKNSVGLPSGWETLVLPFDVQQVAHEEKGVLTPFGVSGSDHHFWLGSYDGTTFAYASAIKANTPYVIAFPNSDDYDASACLNGVIVFSADNATVEATLDVPPVEGTAFSFVPVYQKVYKSPGRYVLNAYDESKTARPGSVFVPNVMSIRTFCAYMQYDGRTAAPKQLPVAFPDGEEYPTPFLQEETGETIYGIDGRRLPDGPATATPWGSIYILNGKKVMIK